MTEHVLCSFIPVFIFAPDEVTVSHIEFNVIVTISDPFNKQCYYRRLIINAVKCCRLTQVHLSVTTGSSVSSCSAFGKKTHL